MLVFKRTKHGADKVVKALATYQIPAEAIHGNKSQNHRQRALANFKAGSTRVLVATDIAARGIDVDDLTHVINYEIPNEPETYVHRIGRTGRAGAFGTAFSFVENDERAYLQDIQKLISKQIDLNDTHPFITPHVRPVELHGRERIIAPKGPAGRPARPSRDGGGSGGGSRSGGGRPSGGGRSGGESSGAPRSSTSAVSGRPAGSGRGDGGRSGGGTGGGRPSRPSSGRGPGSERSRSSF